LEEEDADDDDDDDEVALVTRARRAVSRMRAAFAAASFRSFVLAFAARCGGSREGRESRRERGCATG